MELIHKPFKVSHPPTRRVWRPRLNNHGQKKPSFVKIRPPKIRITSKGVKLINVGATVGGKNARFNLSRKRISASAGVPGASFNTRRGCLLSPFTLHGSRFKRRC
jgi:hypothetical protein